VGARPKAGSGQGRGEGGVGPGLEGKVRSLHLRPLARPTAPRKRRTLEPTPGPPGASLEGKGGPVPGVPRAAGRQVEPRGGRARAGAGAPGNRAPRGPGIREPGTLQAKSLDGATPGNRVPREPGIRKTRCLELPMRGKGLEGLAERSGARERRREPERGGLGVGDPGSGGRVLIRRSSSHHPRTPGEASVASPGRAELPGLGAG